MQLLNVTQYPIYLPADTAQLPFGDPLSDITVTSTTASTVFTSPGYNPANGDRVGLSAYNTASTTGYVPAGFAAGIGYFVVSASNDTFSLASTSNGTAIIGSSSAVNLTIHLLSAQKYGTKHPFKTGDTVVALNLGSTALTLQAAPDVNAAGPFGNPGGPGTYTTLATIASASAASVVLSNDWISLTGAGTLALVQN
jgi:hypothetical protein